MNLDEGPHHARRKSVVFADREVILETPPQGKSRGGSLDESNRLRSPKKSNLKRRGLESALGYDSSLSGKSSCPNL